MTHDPEAAERLVAILTPLITEQSCGEWDDKTINEDVQMFLPPLLAALQEARNAALWEAAEAAKGEGPPAEPDIRKTTKAMVDAAFRALPADADGTIGSGEMYRVLDAALAAAPDPQPTPQSNATHWECPVCQESATWNKSEPPYCGQCAADNGRDVRMVPAPQPDADEREAMVVAMSMDIRDNIDIEWAEAKTVADALLAAGWTRKREEG